MSLFSRKTSREKLDQQKNKQFELIDENMKSAHSPEFLQSSKANWLGSRGAYLAERGDLKNAELDIQEALEMAPEQLMNRVAAVEIFVRIGNFDKAVELVENTPKTSFTDNHSAMSLFSYYDRAAAAYAGAGDKKKYVIFAKKSIEILKTKEYANEDELVSESLRVSKDNIQNYINEIENQIKTYER